MTDTNQPAGLRWHRISPMRIFHNMRIAQIHVFVSKCAGNGTDARIMRSARRHCRTFFPAQRSSTAQMAQIILPNARFAAQIAQVIHVHFPGASFAAQMAQINHLTKRKQGSQHRLRKSVLSFQAHGTIFFTRGFNK